MGAPDNGPVGNPYDPRGPGSPVYPQPGVPAVLSRQASATGNPAALDNHQYVEMDRGIPAPVPPAYIPQGPAINNGPVALSTGAVPRPNPNDKARPTSTHTLYDPEDAYGGM